jgi:outer membrane receptor protein involved in Fe transport
MRAGTGADKNKYVDSSYLTVDCSVTYQANNNLNLYVKGYNLFNEAYAEQGGLSYGTLDQLYPAQSRRFIVGAEYKF